MVAIQQSTVDSKISFASSFSSSLGNTAAGPSLGVSNRITRSTRTIVPTAKQVPVSVVRHSEHVSVVVPNEEKRLRKMRAATISIAKGRDMLGHNLSQGSVLIEDV